MGEEALIAVGRQLDKIGWGSYQNFVTLNVALAWTTDQMWAAAMGFILSDSAKSFSLSDSWIGLLGDCFILGLTLGSYGWGFLGDRYGRMFAFKKCVVMAAVASCGLTFAPNVYTMIPLLVVLGFGVDGELAVGCTVFSEFCPPKKLWMLNLLGGFWGLGGGLAVLVGLTVFYANNTSVEDWRVMMFVYFLIELVAVGFRVFMDETPAYYLSTGNEEKAQNIIRKIALKNNKVIDFEDTQSSEFLLEKEARTYGLSLSEQFKKLLGKKELRKTMLFTFVSFT